jgi:hypothetical protein
MVRVRRFVQVIVHSEIALVSGFPLQSRAADPGAETSAVFGSSRLRV